MPSMFHSRMLIALILAIVAIGGIRVINARTESDVTPLPNTRLSEQRDAIVTQPPGFNKNLYAISDPSSIWVVVNKRRPLSPKTYTPSQLVVPNMPLRLGTGSSEMRVSAAMSAALEQMALAAKKEGANLMLASGYRSYGSQSAIYSSHVKTYGQVSADRQSARPGHSEHQTGLAADLEPSNRTCEIAQCFGTLAEGKWLAANAYKYGFIIRYRSDKEAVTGYMYEPWHVRYVGVELATEMNKQGTTTLEEFFGLPAAPTYE